MAAKRGHGKKDFKGVMVELSQALGEGEQGATTKVYLTCEQLKQLASLFHLALREDEKNG